MGEEIDVQCPWCGETLGIWIEADVHGVMVRDCDVCCRPWSVHVQWTDEDAGAFGPRVWVDRA